MQIRNFSAAGLRAFGRTLASLPGEALFPCVLHRSFAAQSPVERCVCSGQEGWADGLLRPDGKKHGEAVHGVP